MYSFAIKYFPIPSMLHFPFQSPVFMLKKSVIQDWWSDYFTTTMTLFYNIKYKMYRKISQPFLSQFDVGFNIEMYRWTCDIRNDVAWHTTSKQFLIPLEDINMFVVLHLVLFLVLNGISKCILCMFCMTRGFVISSQRREETWHESIQNKCRGLSPQSQHHRKHDPCLYMSIFWAIQTVKI